MRFCLGCGGALEASNREPQTYTPKHLAEKILGSRAALEGERKQVTVTVLFADVKGSMELAEQFDPEEGLPMSPPGGEVLVSSTVRDLVAGSGITFDTRGQHRLGGVPGEWSVFAARA